MSVQIFKVYIILKKQNFTVNSSDVNQTERVVKAKSQIEIIT